MPRDDTRCAEILDTIFHDVRTPLTVISLRVQMLTRELDRGRSIDRVQMCRQLDEVAEQVQVIQRVLIEAEGRQGQ
jgi:K+-sensing histidine kinase KdpD